MNQADVIAETPGARAMPLLLCLSHLRWDFVFQRPQHLMTHAARTYRVVFFEEPLPSDAAPATQRPTLRVRTTPEGIVVATPLLPPGLDAAASDAAQRDLLDGMLAGLQSKSPLHIVWFYTPMALPFAGHLRPALATVFDSMDELSAFRGASPRLLLLERRLLRQADLMFTGGRSLHEAKRRLHSNAHLFPSSVDAAHFSRARRSSAADGVAEPADQAHLPHPRLGFFGVVDERIDLDLLCGIARRRPDWQLVMVGPVAKIDPASLPRLPNVHWLGMKAYAELPAYLSGWDVALMPFALNEATQFISPTKTPEYLAAGVPVVSTPIADVVHDWARDGLVTIASDVDGFVAAAEARLDAPEQTTWLARVDKRLQWMSWGATWARMAHLIDNAGKARSAAASQEPATGPSHA